ncbi:uncharacterized protein [Haliotis asinina]|uniref:uncharacterized protein n=1 Tax=Haliotis asinina TaxID=109174 RepID=UPI003531AB4C
MCDDWERDMVESHHGTASECVSDDNDDEPDDDDETMYNFVKRKATKAARKLPSDFPLKRDKFISGQLLSYDVMDLFTNVPREEALTLIKSRVQDAHSIHDTHLSPDSIFDLINAYISSTYFTWQDQIYQQTHGLPMVDDTFVILPPSDDPTILLQHLNAQNPQMQFTMQTETDNKLPFLDVLVQRENHTLTTSVYRKPTHTDQYIHFSSYHPIQVRRGVITTLTHRAQNISSTPELHEIELDHLRHAFTTYYEYPPSFVNQTIKSTLHPTTKSPRQQSAPFTISIPYIGSTTNHIRRLLKQQANIDVTFQKGNTLQNLLQLTSRPIVSQKPQPAGVVYHIECDCGDTYASETPHPSSTDSRNTRPQLVNRTPNQPSPTTSETTQTTPSAGTTSRS